jgi:hypothetical protein
MQKGQGKGLRFQHEEGEFALRAEKGRTKY